MAELIGTKLFLNEFIAYDKLSVLKNNRLNGILEDGVDKKWLSVSIYVIIHNVCNVFMLINIIAVKCII